MTLPTISTTTFACELSLGEKIFMVFIGVMQGAGLISTGFYVAGLLGFN